MSEGTKQKKDIKHRDLLEHQIGGRVHIVPAPEGLNTFATDLETGEMLVPDNPFAESGVELTDPEEHFCLLHEGGHLTETIDLLDEPGGALLLKRHIERLKKSRAFGMMDNCVADIRENRWAIKKAGGYYSDVEQGLYKEKLFKELGFTARPRHVQFCEALLREARVSGEQCQVAPEVRAKIEELRAVNSADGDNLLEAMTHPDTPMSTRIELQDDYIWPIVQELLEEDKKDKQKSEQQDRGGSKGEKETSDPNEVFKKDYDESKKRNPHASSVDELDKALKEWQDKHQDPIEQADAEYAKKMGVEKGKLQNYRNIVKSLDKIKNPETGESSREEMRRLIERIIATRLKPAPIPRYPIEEGDFLADPTELFTQVKAGNLEPKVWESTEIKEVKQKRYGEIEITLICDRTDSMNRPGTKLIEQRKAGVLLAETLKELGERSEEERINLDKPLVVRFEAYTIQADADDSRPAISISHDISEKARVEFADKLASAPGPQTTDYLPLEAIANNLDEQTKRKIKKGELKKIVIIYSDGESHDADRVGRVLKVLREAGVIDAPVGITDDGKAVLVTYAPNGRLAKRAEDLPTVLTDILKEHLADV